MPNGKNNQKSSQPQRPVPPKWMPKKPQPPQPRPALTSRPPAPPRPAPAGPVPPAPKAPPAAPAAVPAAVAPEEDIEEILIKDANGTFKVLKKGELQEVALKTSREVIDRIQKEIVRALEKKEAVEGAAKPVPEVFNPEEDAKDVARAAPRPVASAKVVSEMDLPKFAQEVVTKSGITLKDPILLNRLKAIIITQLRGVRKLLDTRLILIRPTQLGGMGFDGMTADKIIEAVSKILTAFEKQEKKEKVVTPRAQEEFSKIKSTFAPAEAKAVARPATAAAPQPVAPRQPPTPPQPVKLEPPRPAPTEPKWPSFVQTTLKGAPPKPPLPAETTVPATPMPTPASMPAPTLPVVPEKPAIEIPVKDFTPKISAATRPQETSRITDIRAPFQLVGPVQELAYPLVDFRRLADSPHRAILKIEEKLKNLEAESFAQKIQGIRAWQSSEVFQIYLAMGLEALKLKTSLDDIIKMRQMANKTVLTKEEFEVVNELNARLQF